VNIVDTRYTVYTDASSRHRAVIEKYTGRRILGKKHPSSIGAIIKEGKIIIRTISRKVGIQDSNYAEFLAMHSVCRELINLDIKKVDFYTDCINLSMMVNQGIISGIGPLRKLSYSILNMLDEFDSFTITWINRRYNGEAHKAAKKAFRINVEIQPQTAN
jgi:ribonuclease HI